MGVTAISQFPHLLSQNLRDLKAYGQAVEAGRLPVERGLVVRDPELLERRGIIHNLMCRFQEQVDPQRFRVEWADLQGLASDGLVELVPDGRIHVTDQERWLIRTIAAVFDPAQRQRASGSRLA